MDCQSSQAKAEQQVCGQALEVIFHLKSAPAFTTRMLWASQIAVAEIKRAVANGGLSRSTPRARHMATS
jgi:hypothetical protein